MSAYKVIEIIGSSPDGWEAAAKTAILEAAKSIRHLRVAEVDRLDCQPERRRSGAGVSGSAQGQHEARSGVRPSSAPRVARSLPSAFLSL
ncbi:MAG: dodecin family protein [Chromatiales bacterium]|nr:dodecin family protein [Chromatiales bacterium]